MTQDDYKLWTGSTTSYTPAEWTKITTAAGARLARFLCLDQLPNPMPTEFEELYANFIAAVLARSGSTGNVERKTVRNFTVEFREPTAADAFAAIYQQFGDVIEAYSDCGRTINVPSTRRHCCR